MKITKIILIILGILLAIVGLFYLLFPHSIHMLLKVDFGLEHITHIIIGAISLFIGIILLTFGKIFK